MNRPSVTLRPVENSVSEATLGATAGLSALGVIVMRKLLSGLFGGLFLVSAGLPATDAQAVPLRFSVEVESANLYFQEFHVSKGGVDLPEGSPEIREVANAVHPQSAILGQTGTSVLELTSLSLEEIDRTPSSDYTHALTCLSGFLCDIYSGNLFSGYGEYQPSLAGTKLNGFTYRHGVGNFPVGTSWSLDFLTGTGSLSTDDDGAIDGTGVHDGWSYFWWAPRSQIAFTNVHIVPSPLPASVLLMAAGLIPLALLRRRKS